MSTPSFFSYRHLESALRASAKGNYLYSPVPHAAATETLWRLWSLEHAHGKWWQGPPSEAAAREGGGNSPWLTIGQTELMPFVERCQLSFRFTITRNPYTRLLAAYLTHIARDTTVGRAFRRLSSLPAGSRLDFPQFVAALERQPGHERQPLFTPQEGWMLLDCVPYHFIGAVEQYGDSVGFIAGRIAGGAPGAGERKGERKGGHTDALRHLPAHYTAETRQRVERLHADDFLKFGYSRDLADAARAPDGVGERLFQRSLYHTPFWRLVDSKVLMANGQTAPAVEQIERTLREAEAGGAILPDLRAELARLHLNGYDAAQAEALLTSLPSGHASIDCALVHADLELRRNDVEKALSLLLAALRRGRPTPAVLRQVGALAAAANDADAVTAAAGIAVDAAPAGAARDALIDALVDGAGRRRSFRLATVALECIESLADTGYDAAGRLQALKRTEGAASRAVTLPELPAVPVRDSASSDALADALADAPADALVAAPPPAVAPSDTLRALMEEAADSIEFARQRLLRKVLAAYPHLFDAEHYARLIVDIDKLGISPLEHYIRQGSRELWREPNPFLNHGVYLHHIAKVFTPADALVHYVIEGAPNGLDPGPFFDTTKFLRERPDIAGTTLNPLNEYLADGPRKRGEHGLLPAYIHDDLHQAAFVDVGLFPNSWRLAALLHDTGTEQADKLGRVYSQVVRDLPDDFSHLVLLPWIAHPGGAERVAMFALRMLVEQLGIDRIAVIGTDFPSRKGFDMPDGLCMVSFLDYEENLLPAERIELIDRIILERKPKVTYNLNSLSTWSLLIQKAHLLYRETDFYVTVFGYGFNDVDGPFGYPYMLENCLDYVSGVFVDNSRFPLTLERIAPLNAKDRGKIHVIYTPYDTDLSIHSPDRPPPGRRALWMSRFAVEKRMDVLGSIASRTPERQYLVYGSQIEHAPAVDVSFLRDLPNVDIRGYFRDLGDIPFKDCDVFVYTSAYDGLPVALLEVTAMGLPIIAPDVGGISDLITAETGWLVSGPDAVDEYLAALKEIESNPELARRKVRAAQALLRTRHDWQAFTNHYKRVPGFF